MYNASYQDIIASADIDSSGNFTIKGNDLPADNRFYRLYVTPDVQTRNAVYAGSHRNYILLAMNNKTEVGVYCADFCAPYFVYTVMGSPQNEDMLAVQNIVNNYYSAYRDSLGASKKEFLNNKRYTDLKQFADTTANLMAGLWAVIEMDMTANYARDAVFFHSFAEKFRKGADAPNYYTLLNEQISLLQYKNGNRESRPSVWLLIAITLLLICSIIMNVYLLRRKARSAIVPTDNDSVPVAVNEESAIKTLIETLTIKEREILQMVHEGLSNKEIADKLNVEVSTIKTHVSRIYQKTDIKNRKEVAKVARYLQLIPGSTT